MISPASEQLTVDLSSGRTLQAEIDPRTGPERLWLRSRRESAVVLRPIRWDRVTQVQMGGQRFSGEQFHRMIESIRGGLAAKPDETADERRRIVLRAPHGSARSRVAAGVAADATSRKVPLSTPIRALAIEAIVANWDADVEMDGLAVRIRPLDAHGAVVPADGMLQAELHGERFGESTRRRPMVGLGRWTRRLRSADFGPDGVAIRLPFQGVHPEFDSGVTPYGALHIRLTVAGNGTFEATESSVRIRPYSAVRDRLQQATGSRFFPQERKGRSR